MAKKSLSGLILQKTIGASILWATVGITCLQVFFYVAFGAAA